jgi:magnesium transporter
MIKVYNFEGSCLRELNFNELKSHITDTIWVDLICPTAAEKRLIEEVLGIKIPTHDEMYEIELSRRLYQRNNTIFSTITFITQLDTPHLESHALAFVLHNKWLITIRYVEEFPYSTVLAKAKFNAPLFKKGSFIFSVMLEDMTEQLADVLENTAHNIEEISRHIFKYNYASNGPSKVSKPNFKEIISQIGHNEDLLSRVRESLFTITRMLGFVLQTSYFQAHEEKKLISIVMRDTTFLIEHATFLSNKINFLLDASLGMINIEQSSIIKIVSVAAVVFLPPTLVASIYGMNFHYMPELNWYFGYPLAIVLTILSGFLPYKYFKYKRWL